jgi:hypothetical protein
MIVLHSYVPLNPVRDIVEQGNYFIITREKTVVMPGVFFIRQLLQEPGAG